MLFGEGHEIDGSTTPFIEMDTFEGFHHPRSCDAPLEEWTESLFISQNRQRQESDRFNLVYAGVQVHARWTPSGEHCTWQCGRTSCKFLCKRGECYAQ